MGPSQSYCPPYDKQNPQVAGGAETFAEEEVSEQHGHEGTYAAYQWVDDGHVTLSVGPCQGHPIHAEAERSAETTQPHPGLHWLGEQAPNGQGEHDDPASEVDQPGEDQLVMGLLGQQVPTGMAQCGDQDHNHCDQGHSVHQLIPLLAPGQAVSDSRLRSRTWSHEAPQPCWSPLG
jgi:hypothetical protein